MRVLMIEPMKPPYLTEIGTELEDLQMAVGGMIQEVCPWKDPVALVCNDEGKLIGLPANRVLCDDMGHIYDVIAGPFFICGVNEDDYTDIPDDMIDKYSRMFRLAEIVF